MTLQSHGITMAPSGSREDSPPPLPAFASAAASPVSTLCEVSPTSSELEAAPMPCGVPAHRVAHHSSAAAPTHHTAQPINQWVGGFRMVGAWNHHQPLPHTVPSAAQQGTAGLSASCLPLVRAALGKPGYEAVRAALCRQQTQFTSQLYELHKLCQLHRIILSELEVLDTAGLMQVAAANATASQIDGASRLHTWAPQSSLTAAESALGPARPLATGSQAANHTATLLSPHRVSVGYAKHGGALVLRPTHGLVVPTARMPSGALPAAPSRTAFRRVQQGVARTAPDTRARLAEQLSRDVQLLLNVPRTVRAQAAPPRGCAVPVVPPSHFRVRPTNASTAAGHAPLVRPAASLLVTWAGDHGQAHSAQATVQQRPSIEPAVQQAHTHGAAHWNNTAGPTHDARRLVAASSEPAAAATSTAAVHLVGHTARQAQQQTSVRTTAAVPPSVQTPPALPPLFGHLLNSNVPSQAFDADAGMTRQPAGQVLDPHSAWFSRHYQGQAMSSATQQQQQPQLHNSMDLAPWTTSQVHAAASARVSPSRDHPIGWSAQCPVFGGMASQISSQHQQHVADVSLAMRRCGGLSSVQRPAIKRWWQDPTATFGALGLIDPSAVEPRAIIADGHRVVAAAAEQEHVAREDQPGMQRGSQGAAWEQGDLCHDGHGPDDRQQGSDKKRMRATASTMAAYSGDYLSGGCGGSVKRKDCDVDICGDGVGSIHQRGDKRAADGTHSGQEGTAAVIPCSAHPRSTKTGSDNVARLCAAPSAFKAVRPRRVHSKHASNRMTCEGRAGDGSDCSSGSAAAPHADAVLEHLAVAHNGAARHAQHCHGDSACDISRDLEGTGAVKTPSHKLSSVPTGSCGGSRGGRSASVNNHHGQGSGGVLARTHSAARSSGGSRSFGGGRPGAMVLKTCRSECAGRAWDQIGTLDVADILMSLSSG